MSIVLEVRISLSMSYSSWYFVSTYYFIGSNEIMTEECYEVPRLFQVSFFIGVNSDSF